MEGEELEPYFVWKTKLRGSREIVARVSFWDGECNVELVIPRLVDNRSPSK